MTPGRPLQGIGGVAPYPFLHRPSKFSHTFTYSSSLIPELVILTVMVGKLRVGADMGSVGSREGEGGEQSAKTFAGARRSRAFDIFTSRSS